MTSLVEGFQLRHQVTLPSEFSVYLLSNRGGQTRKISSLDDWCQPYTEREVGEGFLARPFPHAALWNDTALLAQSGGWSNPYYAPALFCGAIRFENIGDEEYALLVVTGPERGNVWIDARVSRQAGIYPLGNPNSRRVGFSEYINSPSAE